MMQLSNTKYTFSKDFYEQLIIINNGFIASAKFDKIIELFQFEAGKYYFNQTSETNLLRIITSLFDKISFLNDSLKYPHHVQILIAIAANSNYLTDIVVKNPEFLYQIFNSEFLSLRIKLTEFQEEVRKGISKYKFFTAKLNYLKNIKRRTLLKIAVNDILNLENLVLITEQLSVLAKIILSELFELCYHEILVKYSITKTARKYCLVSLGKLGGNELNYSSDVDLMLFFDKNSRIIKANKEYFSILEETTHLFIKSASELTSKGYLYRIDFRLRPDGRNSPLARTLHDTIIYYETKGELWERQMLIKLDYVSGSESLFGSLKKFVIPFTYSTSTTSPLERIKKMKDNIERKSSEENIKLFSGGIRDIEFSIQALQLIKGRKIKQLQTGNTLIAISALLENRLISNAEADILKTAYVFYRRAEHFLQLMNDKQTHDIPRDIELKNKLAVYLNQKSTEELESTFSKYRAEVRNFYNSIFSIEEERGNKNLRLDTIQFIAKKKSQKNYQFLKNGLGLLKTKQFSSRTTKLFLAIEPVLMKKLKISEQPDKIIENFAKVVERIRFPSIWYNEFKNEKFFMQFLNICERSQRAINLILWDSSLHEFFLSRSVFQKNIEKNLSGFSLNQILFLLSVQFSAGLLNTERFSKILTDFLNYKIIEYFNTNKLNYQYFIGGLGSFGTYDMNFESDIDLIVVAKDIISHPRIQKDFQQFRKDINTSLAPFKVDFRLRPEGKGSPLVWEIKDYISYLDKRARVWEFQALTKIRFIIGSKGLFNEFISGAENSFNRFEISKIVLESNEMYKKILTQNSRNFSHSFNIKKSKGSLLTIDFILQFLILQRDSLITFLNKNTVDRIEKLQDLGFPNIDLNEIKSNYIFLKTLELTNQNIFAAKAPLIPTDTKKLDSLASLLGITSGKELLVKIKNIAEKNHSLYEKIFSHFHFS